VEVIDRLLNRGVFQRIESERSKNGIEFGKNQPPPFLGKR